MVASALVMTMAAVPLGVVVVAGHVGERPVGGAARDVGEARPEVEAGQRFALADARRRAGGAVRRAVIGARVAVDHDGRRRPW